MTVGIWSSATNPTDFAQKSFASMLTRLYPAGGYPLFLMSSMLPEATAVQFDHGYWTKTMEFPTLTTSAAYAAGETALAVTDTSKVCAGQVFRTPNGENVLVRTVTDATHVTVLRNFGTAGVQNIANGAVLYLVGTAMAESSQRPSARYIVPTRVTNYTQIFRNTWMLSGTQAATNVVVGNGTIAENRADCALFHATDIEQAALMGQKYSNSDPTTGQPLHAMDGLENSIKTLAAGNVTTAGATTTFNQLETALDPVFNQNTDPTTPNERVLFVGGTALKVINAIGKLYGQYQILDGQTSFGLQFKTFKITRGTFRMMEHPILNTNATWAKMAVAVDLTTFRLAYLKGRKTSNQEFGTTGVPVDNGVDAVGGTLTSELTCEIRNPAANAIIYNLTAAA